MDGGKRLALLVGCNYFHTSYELRGCINDVKSMKKVLPERFGFKKEDIELITDEPGSSIMPTGANIKKALKDMIDRAEEGDLLCFFFSGHGTDTFLNRGKYWNDAIVASDFNLVTDLDFTKLVKQLPANTTFTFMSDSCYSGGLLDQEKEQIGPSETNRSGTAQTSRPKFIPLEKIIEELKQHTGIDSNDIGILMRAHFKDEASLSFSLTEADRAREPEKGDYGILLSGCQADELSGEMEEVKKEGVHGAFTFALEKVLEKNSEPISNKEVVIMTRKLVNELGYSFQHPCLYCSDHNADATFLLQPSTKPPN